MKCRFFHPAFVTIIFAFAAPAYPATPDIQKTKADLKTVYDADIEQIAAPADGGEPPAGKDPLDLLSEHSLISPRLKKHVGNIGGLDFDILLYAEDWDKSWSVTVGEPVQKGETHYEIPVTMIREGKPWKAVWSFVLEKDSWLAEDITYEEPAEKPLTLNSLHEGD
jgi:hypothetical protein